jgi:putative heme iron utilization protein
VEGNPITRRGGNEEIGAGRAGIEAQGAEMTSVDRLGFQIRLKTQDGMRGARIAFLREVSDPAQTREVFIEMVQQARQA